MTGTVLVAYLHPNTVSHNFSDSLMRLFAYDIQHEARVARGGGPMMFRCGPGGLVEARNDVVRHFLDEFDADWLWFVDSDMGFAPDTVDRLVQVADPVQRPVVGALCFGMRETAPDGLNGWQTTPFPTLYDWAKKPDGETGFLVRRTYPVNSVVRVAGTGAACLLIHRSILARIRDELGDVWFDRSRYPSGTPISEDLSFCARVNQLGVPVMVCTGVRTNHHKQVWLGEDYYWRTVTPPPATERTAVIVPVMQRPQNAHPFMESLRASTGLATAYAVADPDDRDTIAAWRTAGAEVLLGDDEWVGSAEQPVATTFAEKVNLGYRQTSEPWLFLAGDDVRFHSGWLDHAQAVANAEPFIDVVGTNDLVNPRVTAGLHATHMLIRRSYIDEHGASWDGPKTVCHEGYRHWYVDNELVAAAQQRQVWAMALGSRVEHRHPLFGGADNDAVYELGRSHQKQDYALWRQRLATHAPEAAGA